MRGKRCASGPHPVCLSAGPASSCRRPVSVRLGTSERKGLGTMEQDKKYPVLQNLAYCIRETRKAYPKLLAFCLLIILLNCLVPVITAFLPKIVIDGIT